MTKHWLINMKISVSRLHIVSNNIKKIKQIYSLDSCLQREGQQDRWMTNNWKWWFQYTPKYVYGGIDTNIEIYIEIKNQANLFTTFMSTKRGTARQMDDKQLEMVIPIYPQICIWGYRYKHWNLHWDKKSSKSIH